jgi:hypothetical protein
MYGKDGRCMRNFGLIMKEETAWEIQAWLEYNIKRIMNETSYPDRVFVYFISPSRHMLE